MLPGSGTDIAAPIARRVMDAIAAPVHVAGAALQVPASIGIAIGTGLEDREELLERADKAMYSTKHAGRERYVIYGAAMRPGHQGGMRVRPSHHRPQTATQFWTELRQTLTSPRPGPDTGNKPANDTLPIS
ncbi:diguanylate cyclase [Arthrobacter sp. AL08]|uniref:diguanylate cyclase domain-containing protein n=1 Tax=unclassified Arthrobacter TaxID=235627 RepID=UPI00249A59C3|nr:MULTISPECIES: diguanylate cyclase [unclassified Arthrobacter]MDI3243357.1 diguanylate cyclase [Arthrobacter sp. AL05]MDI3279366.1 diguanylate cyclase [Arthrobacter sp. AL08]